MSLGAFIRWVIFALYVSLFFTLPLVILWSLPGLMIGGIFSAFVLFYIGYQGPKRIISKLKAQPLSVAQYPYLFSIVEEYCRRLQMPVPRLGIIDTPAINMAVLGFSYRSTHLVLTKGAVNSLTRETLAALIGRELCYLWHGDFPGESWFSQFMSIVDSFIAPIRPRVSPTNPRYYSFQLFIRQIFLYPLCLIPSYILQSSLSGTLLDLKSTRITQLPHALAEGLRIVQAHSERIPFHVPFSLRHLFLLQPPPKDPVARLFFSSDDFGARIKALEKLREPILI